MRVKKRRNRALRRVLRALREPLVLGLFAAADALLPRLSRLRILGLARVIGTVAARLDRRGRRVAEANLYVLFGKRMNARRAEILVRGSYRRAAQIGLDSVWFGRDTRARVARWTRVEEVCSSEVMTARPAIVVAAHYGNWEMTLLVGGLVGLPLLAVVKHQWSQQITDRANRLRSVLGVRLVFADGALRVLLRELRAGGIAGFVLDQYTAPNEGGVWVDFGGLPATVSNGAAMLSRRMNAPVFLGFPHARKDGRYDVACSPAMRPGADETDEAFTQRIVNALLHTIRRHPSQWMLMYPRWQRIPPGSSGEGFPFYAWRT
jgi:KDO2-lipid IV(A) lauroyltransferase